MGPSCRCWILLVLCLSMAGSARAEEDVVMIGKDKLWNAPRPDGPDLSVQHIWRKPRYPGLSPSYVKMDDAVHGQGETGPVTLENAGEQGRPSPGDEVVFGAVVRNVGTRTVFGFDFHWMFDGKDLESGWYGKTLAPDQEVLFTIRRRWEDGRHFIALQVDRARRIEETCEENNWVIDRTDALSFAFFVEESVRDYFKTIRNGLGSYDWADWAQFQVRQMNKEFRDTIYPSCPGGIEERVRLDSVWIIPDGWGHKGGMHTPGVKTPVNLDQPEFYNANTVSEDELDVFTNVIGGVDGVWGFSVDLVKPDPNKDGKNFYAFMPRWITGSEWPLHHELGHQLGRIDNYLIWGDAKDNKAAPGLGYSPPEDFKDGMMFHGNYSHDNAIGKNTMKWDSTYRFYSEHTARSFNRDKGVRRGLFGEYLFDVPEKNTFVFIGPDKEPVAKGDVEIFVGRGRGYTGCGFNASPNHRGTTDEKGAFTLNRSPWDHVFIWGNNGIVMFRVTPAGKKAMAGFLDISHFNLACWRGNGKHGRYTVKLEENR